MNTNTYYITKIPNTAPGFRMQGIIWTSALFTSFFTCFAPLFIQSSERYAFVDCITIKGYEMIPYAPLCTLFLLIAPVINAALSERLCPGKYKVLGCAAMAFIYFAAFSFALLISGMEVLHQGTLVALSEGAFLVPLIYYINLSMVLLPDLVSWIKKC